MVAMIATTISLMATICTLDFDTNFYVGVVHACPNLLNLDLSYCTSITMLPDSIGHLSQLQLLDLYRCKNLKKVPSSIGKLRALQKLKEAMLESITTLFRLQRLYLYRCLSISNLSTTIGLMTSLIHSLFMDLATKEHVIVLAQLNVPITMVVIANCIDMAIRLLDRLDALQNLHRSPTLALAIAHP